MSSDSIFVTYYANTFFISFLTPSNFMKMWEEERKGKKIISKFEYGRPLHPRSLHDRGPPPPFSCTSSSLFLRKERKGGKSGKKTLSGKPLPLLLFHAWGYKIRKSFSGAMKGGGEGLSNFLNGVLNLNFSRYVTSIELKDLGEAARGWGGGLLLQSRAQSTLKPVRRTHGHTTSTM